MSVAVPDCRTTNTCSRVAYIKALTDSARQRAYWRHSNTVKPVEAFIPRAEAVVLRISWCCAVARQQRNSYSHSIPIEHEPNSALYARESACAVKV